MIGLNAWHSQPLLCTGWLYVSSGTHALREKGGGAEPYLIRPGPSWRRAVRFGAARCGSVRLSAAQRGPAAWYSARVLQTEIFALPCFSLFA